MNRIFAMFVGFVFVLLLGCAHRSTTPPSHSYYFWPLRVMPEYPSWAAELGIEGSVCAFAVFDSLGNPAKVGVMSSSHPLLSELSVKALKEWRYKPQSALDTMFVRFMFCHMGSTNHVCDPRALPYSAVQEPQPPRESFTHELVIRPPERPFPLWRFLLTPSGLSEDSLLRQGKLWELAEDRLSAGNALMAKPVLDSIQKIVAEDTTLSARLFWLYGMLAYQEGHFMDAYPWFAAAEKGMPSCSLKLALGLTAMNLLFCNDGMDFLREAYLSSQENSPVHCISLLVLTQTSLGEGLPLPVSLDEVLQSSDTGRFHAYYLWTKACIKPESTDVLLDSIIRTYPDSAIALSAAGAFLCAGAKPSSAFARDYIKFVSVLTRSAEIPSGKALDTLRRFTAKHPNLLRLIMRINPRLAAVLCESSPESPWFAGLFSVENKDIEAFFDSLGAFPEGYGDDWADSLRAVATDSLESLMGELLSADPVKAFFAARKAGVAHRFYFGITEALVKSSSFWDRIDLPRAWAMLELAALYAKVGEHSSAGAILDNVVKRCPQARPIAFRNESLRYLYENGYADPQLLTPR